MKKILYSLIVILAATFTACEDPGTSILYAEEYLELDAATTVTGARAFSYLRVDDGQGVPSGFIVNLGAAHQSSAVNFTFSVDVANSTAIENLHFQVNGTSGSIAAGSSTAELPITILDDNINAGEVLSLVINLTGGDIPVNPNYNSATYNIQVSCPIPDGYMTGDYAITYRDDAEFPFGAETFGPAGTVVTLEVGAENTNRKFGFTYLEGGAYGNDPTEITFDLNCGSLQVPESGALGLFCTEGSIITLGPSDETGTYDTSDDSSFVLIFNEWIQDGACGIDPIKHEVTFTKQ